MCLNEKEMKVKGKSNNVRLECDDPKSIQHTSGTRVCFFLSLRNKREQQKKNENEYILRLNILVAMLLLSYCYHFHLKYLKYHEKLLKECMYV